MGKRGGGGEGEERGQGYCMHSLGMKTRTKLYCFHNYQCAPKYSYTVFMPANEHPKQGRCVREDKNRADEVQKRYRTGNTDHQYGTQLHCMHRYVKERRKGYRTGNTENLSNRTHLSRSIQTTKRCSTPGQAVHIATSRRCHMRRLIYTYIRRFAKRIDVFFDH